MHTKYVNIFEGIDTGGIAGKIRNLKKNFIEYHKKLC